MKAVKCIRAFGAEKDSVKLMCRYAQTDLAPHIHDFVEIVVILKGRARHGNGLVEHEVGAGDVLLIPLGAVHGYRKCSGCELHNVLVRSRVFAVWQREVALGHLALGKVGRAEPRPWLRLSAAELAETDAALMLAAGEASRGDDTGRFLADAKVREVVGRLARLARGGERSGGVGEMRRVQAMLTYVEENLGREFSLAEWARSAGMSVRTLHRLFQRELQAAPGEHLRRRRLARATHHLREGGLTVTEVAQACGYSDSNYFARVFRQEFGCSPREWRAGRGRAARRRGAAN